MAAAAAIYAIATGVFNAYRHLQVIGPQVIVASVAAAVSALTRQVVTPVADPQDGNGKPLTTAVPATPPAAGGAAS